MRSRDGAVLLALQRATHATLQAVADELGDAATGPAEANVLATLAEGTPHTPSELAAKIGSRVTTMTSVLDRLESRGLIARTKHPADRRAVRIELTGPGQQAATRTRDAFRRVEARALAQLPAAAVKALHDALDQMAAPHAR